MSQIVLEYQGVGKRYALGETSIEALRDVSFTISRGEFTAIIGPSGSGKSTLLHLGAGLDEPSSGTISLLGQDISKIQAREMAHLRNKELGFIFQSFNLIPVLSVTENIEYPALLYPDVRENRLRVGELLELTGLGDQARKRPNMLSGGQRQRVAIARALINNPSIVFADEPTANLDHSNGEAIMSLLLDLNRKLGTTFLFSTHDPRIISKARRTLRMEDGALVADSGDAPQVTPEAGITGSSLP